MARITKAEQAAIDQATAEAATKAAQKAEVSRLRAEKAAAKKAAAEQQAIVDAAHAEALAEYAERSAAAAFEARVAEELARRAATAAEPVVERFDPKAEAKRRMEQAASNLDDILSGFEMPSWKRMIIGTVFGLVIAAGAGWAVGTLTGMLIVSAVALTGMAWVGWVVWALGMLIAFFVSGKLGTKAAAYIITAKLDKHAGAAKDKVLGWFKSDEAVITGAFTQSAAA